MQKTIAQITLLPALQDALKIHPVCQIKCAGQKSGSFDALAETFFPQNEYRTEANGGLVPLLSARLQLLGDQACESTAIDRCRGKDRVEEVRAMSLHSGTWKIQLPLDCQKSRGYVLSPYGSLYEGKTETVRTGKLDLLTADGLSEQFSPSTAVRVLPACTHIIHAKVCYGDCMSNAPEAGSKGNDDFVQTLITSDYEGTEKMEVCGDPLWKRWSRINVSASLKEIECRRFFYETVFKDPGWFNTCSAMRASIPDCDAKTFNQASGQTRK